MARRSVNDKPKRQAQQREMPAPLREAVEAVFAKVAGTVSWGRIPSSLDDRNLLDNTPLHTVCTWGDVDAAKTLIAAGADVNAPGDLRCGPIVNAIMSRNAALVRLLLDAGADPQRDNDLTPTIFSTTHALCAPARK